MLAKLTVGAVRGKEELHENHDDNPTHFCFDLPRAASRRTARAAENIRVAYPSLNTSVYCLIVAQNEGYLKEEGLEMQLLSIRGEIAIRSALAGEIDFFTNAGSALAASVRGVPVKIVTVFQDKPGC